VRVREATAVFGKGGRAPKAGVLLDAREQAPLAYSIAAVKTAVEQLCLLTEDWKTDLSC
jgi:hypothetical protein